MSWSEWLTTLRSASKMNDRPSSRVLARLEFRSCKFERCLHHGSHRQSPSSADVQISSGATKVGKRGARVSSRTDTESSAGRGRMYQSDRNQIRRLAQFVVHTFLCQLSSCPRRSRAIHGRPSTCECSKACCSGLERGELNVKFKGEASNGESEDCQRQN